MDVSHFSVTEIRQHATELRARIEMHEDKLDKAKASLCELQATCPHRTPQRLAVPASMLSICICIDCDKIWTEGR